MATGKLNKEAIASVTREQEKRLLAVGFMIEGSIKRSFIAGAGRVYTRKGITHVASAPGDPPAVDTGRLRASISTNWSGSGKARGEVGAKAKLEDGVGPPPTNEEFTVYVGTNVEYACLKADSSVLTEYGWKRISLVKEGDKVLTQTGEYHSVLNLIRVKNTDFPEMVTIEVEWRKNMCRKLTMTSHHKVLVFREGRNKWVTAAELLETDEVFCLPKTAANKGISRFGDRMCENPNCGQPIQRCSNFHDKRKFCSIECRTAYWAEFKANPHLGSKRSSEAKRKMSNSAIQRLLLHPETHVNRILGKKGFRTEAEREVEKWLLERFLVEDIVPQYSVAGHFVDFYVKSENTIYEADGAYWHRNQEKDINRDEMLLRNLPGVKIVHVHFYDARFSPPIVENPLPGVYYSVCNPGTNSFVDLSTFKPYKIRGIKKWTYFPSPNIAKGQKGVRAAYLYDLSVDKVHSYYANGVLVSNSFLEFGTRKMAARPFMRLAIDRFRGRIPRLMQSAKVGSATDAGAKNEDAEYGNQI
jgi:very-short-patch-repair endonuclease